MAEKDKKEKEKEEKAETGLDQKYLKGLNFSDAEEKEIEDGGVKKKKMVPRIQPLQPAHVLSWKEDGKEIVIVTKDGKKYRVKK